MIEPSNIKWLGPIVGPIVGPKPLIVIYNYYRFQTSMTLVDFKFSISKIYIDFRPHKKEIYKFSRFQKSRIVIDLRNLGIIVDFRNLGFL